MNNTVVFITALDSEYTAVLAYLKNLQERQHKGSNYQLGDYVTPSQQHWQVVVRKQANQGNPAAAQETERAIAGFQPQYVFFVGVAGGIKDVNLGDVVAAKTVKGYEKGKVHSNETIIRGDVHHSSPALEQLADKVVHAARWQDKLPATNETRPKAIVQIIASGEKVVTDPEFAGLTKACSDAVATEMEGIGFLQTIHQNQYVQGIVIRGISDLLVKTPEHDETWQPIAARNAAAFAFAMLDELGLDAVSPHLTKEGPGAVVSPHLTQEEPGAVVSPLLTKEGPGAVVSPLLTKEGPGVVSPIFRIPLPRNEYFTGRKDILAQIHDTLPHHPVAVCGLGGLGKTQVAVEYAYQHQGEYTYVFWLAAHDNAALQTGMEAIAKDLGLNQQLPPDQIWAWVKEKFSHTPNWLLVVDNADELVQIQQVFKELLPLPLTTGQVLLTTRQQSPPPPLTPLTLDTLTDDQGAELLLCCTRDLASNSSDLDLARTLSHTLQGLPLALAQAAAYLYQRRCGYQKYLTLYQQNAARLLKERGKLIFDQDHPLPVATTWQVSLTQIQQQQPRALELLHYCAFLSSAGIPEEVLLKVLDIEEFDLEDWLDPILSYSLLTRDSDSQQVRIHSLVQTILRSELGEEKQRDYAGRVICAVNQILPKVDDDDWLRCRPWLPSVLACVGWIEHYHIESKAAARLLNETGDLVYYQSQYDRAKQLYERSLEIRRKFLGEEHPDAAESFNNVALIYDVKGEHDKAKQFYERSLDTWKKVLPEGEEHRYLADTLHNLAGLYYAQSNYAQAEPLYKRGLEIRQKCLGGKHTHIARSLNGLANLYREQGKYDKAEPLYEESLKIREELLGVKHPDVTRSLNGLAKLRYLQRQYDQAKKLYERSVSIWESVPDKNHRDFAESLDGLGMCYKVQGDHEQAKELYKRALTILKKTLGEQHPTTQKVAGNYQELLRQMASQGGAGKES